MRYAVILLLVSLSFAKETSPADRLKAETTFKAFSNGYAILLNSWSRPMLMMENSSLLVKKDLASALAKFYTIGVEIGGKFIKEITVEGFNLVSKEDKSFPALDKDSTEKFMALNFYEILLVFKEALYNANKKNEKILAESSQDKQQDSGSTKGSIGSNEQNKLNKPEPDFRTQEVKEFSHRVKGALEVILLWLLKNGHANEKQESTKDTDSIMRYRFFEYFSALVDHYKYPMKEYQELRLIEDKKYEEKMKILVEEKRQEDEKRPKAETATKNNKAAASKNKGTSKSTSATKQDATAQSFQSIVEPKIAALEKTKDQEYDANIKKLQNSMHSDINTIFSFVEEYIDTDFVNKDGNDKAKELLNYILDFKVTQFNELQEKLAKLRKEAAPLEALQAQQTPDKKVNILI